MTAHVENRQSCPAVDDLIALFNQATHPSEIELLADHLAAARDRRAIRPLLLRLGDCRVQADPDVEDAVCRALMRLDVMCSSADSSFSLRPRRVLADDVVETIRECVGVIPSRYFGTRQI